jgi:hypothetical protein
MSNCTILAQGISGKKFTPKFEKKTNPQKTYHVGPDFAKSGASPKKCGNCGHSHKGGRGQSCPAFGKQCKKCEKWNHFASECCSTTKKSVHEVASAQSDLDSFYMESVDNGRIKDDVHAKLLLNNCNTTVKVDTGANATL